MGLSTEVIKETIGENGAEWEPPMPPTDLIFDDGEPLESNNHRIAMNALIRSILVALADRNDYFVGGNMFIYYSTEQARNRDFRGPDFFVVLKVDGNKERQGWVVWEENGRYPDVIIELMSPSTAKIDKGIKKEIYSQIFRTSDYYVFDPFNPNSLQGWCLDLNAQYQELKPNEQGRLWCQRLGLWLGTWEGSIEGKESVWLRFYDNDGNLVPLLEEAAQQQGLQEGLQQGLQEGLQQGLQEGVCRQLLRLLRSRFGEVSEEITNRLQSLSVDQLEKLTDLVLNVESLEQFLSEIH